MHSSRMLTVRFSGRLTEGHVYMRVFAQLGCVCPGWVSAQGGCLPGGLSAQRLSAKGVVCLEGGLPVCLGIRGGCTPPPVDRILDTRLRKHYLSAALFADGNYVWPKTDLKPIGWFYKPIVTDLERQYISLFCLNRAKSSFSNPSSGYVSAFITMTT